MSGSPRHEFAELYLAFDRATDRVFIGTSEGIDVQVDRQRQVERNLGFHRHDGTQIETNHVRAPVRYGRRLGSRRVSTRSAPGQTGGMWS